MEAYCNVCGITCGKHAVGESCSNNDGGKIVAGDAPAPVTLDQLLFFKTFEPRADIEGVCVPVKGVTEFRCNVHKPDFQLGATCFIYLTDEGDMIANVETMRVRRSTPRRFPEPGDKNYDYPITVRLFTKWRERFTLNTNMIVEEFEDGKMHGLAGHGGARDRARAWVKNTILIDDAEKALG